MAHADFLPTGNQLIEFASGTFTPTMIGSGTAGTATYSQQEGDYRRYGDSVYIDWRMNWTDFTGTGGSQLGGLPLTSDSTQPKGFGPIASSDQNFAGSSTMITLQVQQNVLVAFFINSIDNGALAGAEPTAAAGAEGQAFYPVEL